MDNLAPETLPNTVSNINKPQTNPLAVAKAQKGILILILINIVVVLFARHWVISLLVTIAAIYFTYQLLVSLNLRHKVLWILGLFVPLLSLVLLLILNGKATKAIREAGFKVGFLGANIKEIEAKSQTPNI